LRISARVLLAAAATISCAATIRFAAGAPTDSLVFAVPVRQSTTKLSSAELRQICLGRITRWKDGRRIALAIRPSATRAGRAFFDRVVQMSDIDFSQNWLGIIFRGEAAASPRVLGSSEEVKRFLLRSPGGLAFLLASELDPEDSSVRLLSLDGARPDDASYAFRLR
jgi:ABC-type phosphate transport system substrate-binding protein